MSQTATLTERLIGLDSQREGWGADNIRSALANADEAMIEYFGAHSDSDLERMLFTPRSLANLTPLEGQMVDELTILLLGDAP